MYPNLFGISWLHMYGLCIAVGIVLCFVVINVFCKKKKIKNQYFDLTETLGIVAIFGGFLCASLFQATYNYIADPSKGFNLFTSFTFIGGLIGGVAVFLLFYFLLLKRKYGDFLPSLLPIIPAGITIAHGFGRIGCFCAGCCHGIESGTWLDMTFPSTSVDPGRWLPTQLYEAFFLFILTAIMILLVVKLDFKYNFVVYLVSYGIWRFLIEYIRGDNRGEFIPGVSPSQFWSILMVGLAVGVYFFLKWIYKKYDFEQFKIGHFDPKAKTISNVETNGAIDNKESNIQSEKDDDKKE